MSSRRLKPRFWQAKAKIPASSSAVVRSGSVLVGLAMALYTEAVTEAAERGATNVVTRAKVTRAVQTASLGAAWLEVARLILEEGRPATYDGLPMVEVSYVTLDVAVPDPLDSRHRSSMPIPIAWRG